MSICQESRRPCKQCRMPVCSPLPQVEPIRRSLQAWESRSRHKLLNWARSGRHPQLARCALRILREDSSLQVFVCHRSFEQEATVVRTTALHSLGPSEQVFSDGSRHFSADVLARLLSRMLKLVGKSVLMVDRKDVDLSHYSTDTRGATLCNVFEVLSQATSARRCRYVYRNRSALGQDAPPHSQTGGF
jgi:hypothetical protein